MTSAVTSQEPSVERVVPARRTDLLVLLFSIILATAFHVAFRGHLVPHVGLSGDPANIAGFAAGTDHPDLFVGDAVLGDRDNYRFYGALQVDLVRWLSRFYGDYGFANDALLGLHFWAYAFGWYVFGVLFWRERWCGIAWMLANLVVVPLNLAEFWGLWPDLIPRISYQAALPWLLSLTLWQAPRSPRVWPLIGVVLGLAVWLHPVSAPGWALAILLSFLVMPCRGLSGSRRLRWILLSAGLTVVALLPFVALYFGAKQSTAVDLSALMPIVRERVGRAFYDVSYAVAGFLFWMTRTGLLPLSLGGLWLWRRAAPGLRAAEAPRLRVALAWLAGLLLVSVAMPAVDQVVARFRHALPAQIDLVRNLRYVVPFLIGAWFWPLVLWTREAPNERLRRHRVALVFLGVGLWSCAHRPLGVGLSAGEDDLLQDAIVAIRDAVPVRGQLLTIGVNALPVRYGALRPVVFAEKDGGCFLQVRPDRLPEWFRVLNRYRQVDAMADDGQRLVAGAALARELGAEYLLMRNYPLETPPEVRLRTLFSNSAYRLYTVARQRTGDEVGAAAEWPSRSTRNDSGEL